jgi:hypothetical protein
VRSAFLALLVGLPLFSALTACDDPLARGPVLLLQDTVVIAVPTEGLDRASAIDLIREAAPGLLRFPERAEHAGQWDFALRRSDGGLAMRTFDPGLGRARPGIAETGETFEQMRLAPISSARYVSDPVTLTEGASYYLRSRPGAVFGATCLRFGRMRVLALDLVAGTAELALAINDGCNDERLVLDN